MKVRALISLSALLLVISGCASPIRVEKISALERRSYGVADYSAGTLSLRTVNLLGNFMLNDLYEKDPARVLSKLEKLYKQDPRKEIISAMADLALQTGYKKRSDSDLSSRYFLASAVYSSYYLKELDDTQNLYDENRIRQIRIHNLAMTELFVYLQARGLERRTGFQLPMPGSIEQQIRFNAPVFDLPVGEKDIIRFAPCAAYKTLGLTHDTRVFGLGVPLVAELSPGSRDVGGQLIPELPVAVTLVGDFQFCLRTGTITAQLRYICSRVTDKVRFGTRELPLAADFSTPLASAAGKPQEMDLIERTIKIKEAERITGLYHFEPYDDKRIPVIFVHGLMSDARTWSQMLNTLLHDPVIRKKYQFLGFAYSSGNPVFISAAILRKALKKLREKLVQQDRSTDAFDQMVLVGHSMGGLLSKLQITSCKEELLLKQLDLKDADSLKKHLDAHEVKAFDEIFNFAPLPFVKRVIFIAVPHRGSRAASSFIARAGSSLIELPAALVRWNIQIINGLIRRGRAEAGQLQSGRTGIDNLRPDDMMLRLLGSLKISPAVPFHSIIGNRKAQGIPGGSDGIVPYSSSHLDGAVSEMVVKSGHSVQQNNLAIQEVRRILLNHVESKPGKNL